METELVETGKIAGSNFGFKQMYTLANQLHQKIVQMYEEITTLKKRGSTSKFLDPVFLAEEPTLTVVNSNSRHTGQPARLACKTQSNLF